MARESGAQLSWDFRRRAPSRPQVREQTHLFSAGTSVRETGPSSLPPVLRARPGHAAGQVPVHSEPGKPSLVVRVPGLRSGSCWASAELQEFFCSSSVSTS